MATSSIVLLLLFTLLCLLATVFDRWPKLDGSSHVDNPPADGPRACKRYGSNPEPATPKPKRGHRQSQGKQGPIVGSVDSLYVHPIKSCRAVRVEEAEVLSTGLKYDRNFTFAEYSSTGWKFITQRRYPKLANICLEIWVPDPESTQYSPNEANVRSGGVLRVRYPDPRKGSGGTVFKTFDIPYNPTEKQISKMGYTLEKLTVWKDRPDALLIARTTDATLVNSIFSVLSRIFLKDSKPKWIQEIRDYIEGSKPLALFRVAAGHERQVFRNAPSKEQLGYQSVVGFVDAYPLHILGLSSVADLDRRLAKEVPDLLGTQQPTAMRFRANIYCKGLKAHAEDSWKRIRIGQSAYHVACRTTRCELPNTNQWTGEQHKSQPSKVMKSYRKIDEGAPNNACMGMQMVPAAEWGIIKVGDEIEVLETGEHVYIKQ
ncbi:MAG: hypothetical protein Q9169_001352 [Polycauliona sp. 2 TL-2023]